MLHNHTVRQMVKNGYFFKGALFEGLWNETDRTLTKYRAVKR